MRRIKHKINETIFEKHSSKKILNIRSPFNKLANLKSYEIII